jgi:hypothetical protein
MKILGISALYHDSTACLVVDGRSLRQHRKNASPQRTTASGLVFACFAISGSPQPLTASTPELLSLLIQPLDLATNQHLNNPASPR